MNSAAAILVLTIWASVTFRASPFALQNNTLPTGTLDRIEGISVEGWSFDPDTPDQSVTVRFYMDAPYPQGTFAGEVSTSILREDVNQARGVTGAHGFQWDIPPEFRDGRTHQLYAYGVDTFDPGQLGILFEAPKEFQLTLALSSIQVNNQPYTIGAWYFTAWSSYNDYQAVNSIDAYGRKDPWGGVRDHVEGKDAWGIGMDYARREPLIGFYDLADQSVMDTHIRQAASSGLSYFAFYWYWNTDKNAEDNVTLPIHTFLTSPYRNLMKFMLAPIKLGERPMTRDIWEHGLVPYMVETYFSDPSYLTTLDGRPVVILFDPGFTTVEDNAFAAKSLREQVRSRLNKEPVILWLYNPDWNSDYVAFVQSDYSVDGYACFQLGPATPAESYAATLSHWPEFMLRQQAYFHIPCVSTGLDRRPWYRITWGWSGEGVNDEPYNTDITLAAFQDHLLTVKSYLDSRQSTTSKTLTIYAWNEWGEGGEIEPSRVGGYEYLDAVQAVFGLSSITERPPLQPSLQPTQTLTPIAPTQQVPLPPGGNPVCGAPAIGMVVGLIITHAARRLKSNSA